MTPIQEDCWQEISRVNLFRRLLVNVKRGEILNPREITPKLALKKKKIVKKKKNADEVAET